VVGLVYSNNCSYPLYRIGVDTFKPPKRIWRWNWRS